MAQAANGVNVAMMDQMTGMGSGMIVWTIVGVLLIVLLAVMVVKLLRK